LHEFHLRPEPSRRAHATRTQLASPRRHEVGGQDQVTAQIGQRGDRSVRTSGDARPDWRPDCARTSPEPAVVGIGAFSTVGDV
jgi:hypothetical protein